MKEDYEFELKASSRSKRKKENFGGRAMRTYKYSVTWIDGSVSVLEMEAESVLDGIYRIHRKYGNGFQKACHVK